MPWIASHGPQTTTKPWAKERSLTLLGDAGAYNTNNRCEYEFREARLIQQDLASEWLVCVIACPRARASPTLDRKHRPRTAKA
jgi:hypothetical protein